MRYRSSRARPCIAPASRSPGSEKLDLIDTVFAAQNHHEYANISLACPQSGEFFPTAKIGRIMASLLRREPELIGRYALPPGSPRLRREIARRSMELGITISADDVTLTHGCMEALQLGLRAVTKPGDCVGVKTPTYFYLFPLLYSLGLRGLRSLPIHKPICRWMRWRCCCRKRDYRR